MTHHGKTPCHIHLPGNAECPNRALFTVAWRPASLLLAKPTTKATLRRTVCSSHLMRGIEEALDQVVGADHVEVTMVDR